MPRRSTPNLKHSEITDRIIGAFYHVHNQLGPGLAERLYGRALQVELDRRGCTAFPQSPLDMLYGNARRVRFRADFIVEGKVIIEIKARSRILKSHWAQLLHYMAVSGLEVGLVLNFGQRATFKRLVRTTAADDRCRG